MSRAVTTPVTNNSAKNPWRDAPWIGIAALVLCATMWSLSGPLIKLLEQDGVDGVTIAFYRSAIGGLLFVPFALRRLRSLRYTPPAWPIASVALFTIMTVTFVLATTMTAAANAVVLQYTSPLWVFALSPLLLRERPGRNEGLVLICSMVGVLIIFLGHPTAEVPALAVALTSGFGYGALTVALRGLRRLPPVLVACMNCVGSAALLAPAVAVVGSFALDGRQTALVLTLSLVQFSLPYVLFSWALQRVEAHRASLIVLLETVLNPVFTWLVIGEAVPAPTLIGGPLIVTGVIGWILLTWRRNAPAPQPPDDPAP